jgi:amidase
MSRQNDEQDPAAGRLTRRAFVTTGMIGGAVAAAGPLLPRSAHASDAADAAETPAATAYTPKPFELEEVTLAQLREGMESGRYTARGLAEAYIARIEEMNGQGPNLRAVLEVNPDALSIADALDRERKEKGARGPLHGIPILVKDNIDTADRMTTTAGSLALEGSIAPRDSFVAAQLREAGAVILGKANMSEWANFRSTHSSSGWSSRGGQCRNPYALDRSPSGSSSGSGAAAAANLAAAAIGSETDGSIVSPSAASSLVGIKPTVGLISRAGIIPISHTQDTAGPMARTVADAAVLLGALTGVDERDEATRASRGKSQTDYTRYLDAGALKGARIGVLRKNVTGYSPATDRVFGEALDAMKKAGAVLVDPADLPGDKPFDEGELQVLLYEFKANLNKYFAGLRPGTPVHTLQEAIDFNEKNRDRVMPYFGQELFLQAQEKGPLTEKAYQTAVTNGHQRSRQGGVDAVLGKHQLDALVAPTQGPPWLIDLVNGDSFGGGSSSLAAVAGYPSITVPAGYFRGLPLGLSFVGAAWSEPKLIAFAYAFEQAMKARRSPRFLPTADLGT